MDFGNTLRTLRREKNIGQKELAIYLNVSVSTISNYEKSVHHPDLQTLCKLADYFDVSIDYLMDRTKYRYSLNMLNRKLSDGSDVSDLVNILVNLEAQAQYSLHSYARFLAYSKASRQ